MAPWRSSPLSTAHTNPVLCTVKLTCPCFPQPGLWLSTSSPRVSRAQEQSWLGELSRTDRLGCLWSGSSNVQLWQLFKRSISCAPAHRCDMDAKAQACLPRQIAGQQTPISTGRLNRFVTLKAIFVPLPLSPLRCTSRSLLLTEAITALEENCEKK